MSRSKLLLFFLLTLPQIAFAKKYHIQSKTTPPRAPRLYSSWEVGGSYLMWDEPIHTIKGANESRGIANYGGFGIGVEKHWRKKRMLYSTDVTLAAGKASSAGFSAGAPYNDGVNRAWKAAHLSLSANYGISPSLYIGGGVLARYRSADWNTTDPTLTVQPVASTHVTGILILRWEIARSVQMTQTFAPLDFRGATMWQWIFMLRL